MTGRVLAQLWVSADGMVAGPNGEFDLFASASPAAAEASERHTAALLRDVDTMLLGRRTYEIFSAFWPTAEHPMAAHVNALPRTVCSTRLTDAPWGSHEPCRVTPDGVGWAAEHRAGPGGIAIVWGSVALIRALLDADELDELELFVAPALLGDGVPLYGAGRTVPLRLTESEQWPGGVVRLRYARGPAAGV